MCLTPTDALNLMSPFYTLPSGAAGFVRSHKNPSCQASVYPFVSKAKSGAASQYHLRNCWQLQAWVLGGTTVKSVLGCDSSPTNNGGS